MKWKHAATLVDEELADTDKKTANKKLHSSICTEVVINRWKLYNDLTDNHTNKDDIL